MDRKAVVLLSGGLDSATTLYIAGEEGFSTHAVSFRYGQQHTQELKSASEVARAAGAADHLIIPLDARLFKGSALTGPSAVPENRSPDEMASMIPPTYVPARNTVFLAMSLSYAEVIGARDIFIGVNAVDYSGYPDCRPEFIAAFGRLAELATKEAIEGRPARIHAPLLNMTKAQIIRRGLELGVDYSLTHSCYNPDTEGRSCGRCDACILRLSGFAENGMNDPVAYQPEMNNGL
ncbi:7-cyano-7-deazaguanine synthase QueC [Candidatus Fermentibacteria bacterium]|nr:MAG: 7-cyano-7-deazaguanine synthase QueC [Candidatus Fermentibacteria bacterium]